MWRNNRKQLELRQPFSFFFFFFSRQPFSKPLSVGPHGLWIQFLVAAVTNYHTLSGLNNKFILFAVWRPRKSENSFTGLQSKCCQGCVPSWDLRENLFPCLFHLLELYFSAFLIHVPFSIFFKAAWLCVFFPVATWPSPVVKSPSASLSY